MAGSGWERWERPISFLAAVGWMTCELAWWGGRPGPLLAISSLLVGKEALKLYVRGRQEEGPS